jgi:arylsulfatase A-like enzyme
MHFLEAHEVTGDGANQLDEPISNILDKLDSGGYLDDTVVILISDHGMHIFMVSLRTENFYTERNLPGLMMRLP